MSLLGWWNGLFGAKSKPRDLRDLRQAAMMPGLDLNEDEIKEFFDSRVWLAIKQWAARAIVQGTDDLFDPSASNERLRYAQGWVQALDVLLSQRPVLIAEMRKETKKATETQQEQMRKLLGETDG